MKNETVSKGMKTKDKAKELERVKKQILTYINYALEADLGKKKALEYLYKYVENTL